MFSSWIFFLTLRGRRHVFASLLIAEPESFVLVAAEMLIHEFMCKCDVCGWAVGTRGIRVDETV
jgi:hypothetical protein